MNSNPTQRGDMALIKVRDRGQLTLPPEARTALRVDSGDYLEAHVVEGGVLLTPVAVVERTKAWDKLFAALSQTGNRTGPEPSPEEQERAVAELIAAYRREKRGNPAV